MHEIRDTLRMLLAWMESGRLIDLVVTRHHTPYLTRHRLAAIGTRTKLVAAAFSALTLVWIVFDVATLNVDQWRVLAIFRVFGAVFFIFIVLAPERESNRVRTLTMLGIMLAIPLAIFGVSQFLFAGISLQGLAAVNGHLYETLPLIVLAGLSIFPLVASEGLLFAAVIGFTVAGIQLLVVGMGTMHTLSTLWTLMLALGVYLLACGIQLHYMMALLRRASHDPLTGALTRRSGVEVLDLHFRLACDQDAPLSLLFLDADNFKTINDNYGHDAGDKALKNIAAKLQALLRQADLVIRWGGEEFLVILNDTPMSGAGLVVSRLMHEWLGTRPDGAPLTASIGLAERQVDAVADWSQLIALADERMYAAKTSGKACCVNHEGILTSEIPAA